MPGHQIIDIGPAEAWSAPIAAGGRGCVDGGRESVRRTRAVPAYDVGPPVVGWTPFTRRRLKESCKVVIDRGEKTWTPAGASMPTAVYATKLAVMLDFVKVETPLEELAWLLGYEGGSTAMDALGLNAAGGRRCRSVRPPPRTQS